MISSIPIHPYDVYDVLSEGKQTFVETGELIDETVECDGESYTMHHPIFVIDGKTYHCTTRTQYKSTTFADWSPDGRSAK